MKKLNPYRKVKLKNRTIYCRVTYHIKRFLEYFNDPRTLMRILEYEFSVPPDVIAKRNTPLKFSDIVAARDAIELELNRQPKDHWVYAMEGLKNERKRG